MLNLKLVPWDTGPTMIHLGGFKQESNGQKQSLDWNEYTITEKKWKEE